MRKYIAIVRERSGRGLELVYQTFDAETEVDLADECYRKYRQTARETANENNDWIPRYIILNVDTEKEFELTASILRDAGEL